MTKLTGQTHLLSCMDLLRRLNATEAAKESQKPKKRVKETGYRLNASTGHRQVLLCDADVILLRGYHDFYGYGPKDLSRLVDVSYEYLCRLMTYEIRSRCHPREIDFPRPAPGAQRPSLEVLAEKLRANAHNSART